MNFTVEDMLTITGIPHVLSECGEFWQPVKDSPEAIRYRAGNDNQIEQWLLGNYIHNEWTDNLDHQECTPCAMCCSEGGVEWTLEEKLLYLKYHDMTSVAKKMFPDHEIWQQKEETGTE